VKRLTFDGQDVFGLEARHALHLRGRYHEGTLRGFDQHAAERRERHRQRHANRRADPRSAFDGDPAA